MNLIVKVTFFKPAIPEGNWNDLQSVYGVAVTPKIEAAFYADLVARAVAAVESMKRSGSWPSMEYTKCGDYSGDIPITRNVDLMTALSVSNSKFHQRLFSYISIS